MSRSLECLAHAVSIDGEFASFINKFAGCNAVPVQVHSIFKNSVNLLSRDQGLFTIAAAGSMDNAPRTMLIELDKAGEMVRFFSRLDEFVFDGRYLKNSRAIIDLQRPSLWEPQEIKKPSADAVERSILVIKEFLKEIKGKHWLNYYQYINCCDKKPSFVYEQFDRAIKHPEELSRLLGLGEGLTPAGDDFIAGALMALRTLRLKHVVNQNRLLELAEYRTNIISYWMLRAIVEDKYRDSFANLINSMSFGGFRSSMVKISEIGGSSGVHILTGFAAFLQIFACEVA